MIDWFTIGIVVSWTLFCFIDAKTRQEILTDLIANTSGGGYDCTVPPNFNEDGPTNVSVQIFVLSFDSITEATMVNKFAATAAYLRAGPHLPTTKASRVVSNLMHVDQSVGRQFRHSFRGKKQKGTSNKGFEFSMSIFLRQNWIDPRLRWSDPHITEKLEVDPRRMGQVWVPDLYFINEREAIMHEVTLSNKLLHIYQDGSIIYSMRISMTLSCDMFLDRYPHDQQICSVCLGSYSFSQENVMFQWVKNPVIMRKVMTSPRFTVHFQKINNCDFLFTEDENMITDDFSCLQADFLLQRQFGYYIAQVYVPSILIVMLSWLSFWIDIDATPARVSLGLLTVLTITTQTTGEKAALPRVSYIKAIDVWMSTCLFFVFAALLEFAYVNVRSRVEKKRRDSVQTNQRETFRPSSFDNDSKAPRCSVHPTTTATSFGWIPEELFHARRADKLSRIVFPCAFVIFNIAYWIYYR